MGIGVDMDLITSLTSQVMNKALNGLSKRHEAISGNLANVDTPNYKRRDVTFEGALQQAIQESKGQQYLKARPATNDEPLAMRSTHRSHFSTGYNFRSLEDVQPQVIESGEVAYRNDGNSVDVETEMVELAENTQKYSALTNLQGRAFRSIRSIISGSGGS